jgi:hypothetical protein
MSLSINDRGKRGLVVPRRIAFNGGVDLTGSLYAFEDFVADHLAEDSSVKVNQAGTPIAAAAISAAFGAPTAGHGGWIGGATDDVDANIVDEVALGALPWLVPAALAGGRLIVAETAFVVPTALTARRYFVGLSDDETEGTGDNPITITTGTTISATADDAAGFIMSSQATDADGYYTGAVKATVVGTALNVSTSPEGAAVGPAVVDDYTKLRLEVDVNGSVYFYGIVSGTGQREVQAAFCDFQNAAVTASVPLIPLFSASTTGATSVEWEIDYMYGGVVL